MEENLANNTYSLSNLSFLAPDKEQETLKKLADKLGTSKAQLARGCFRIGFERLKTFDLKNQIDVVRLGMNSETFESSDTSEK